jgi:WD40 repeat protein
MATLAGHTAWLRRAVWNQAGDQVLTISDDATARLWDPTSGRLVQTFWGHTGALTRALWSQDERQLLTASTDGTVRIWETALTTPTVGELPPLSGHEAGVNRAYWNGDESRILTASDDGTVRQYYTHSAEIIAAACARAIRNMTADEWAAFMPGQPYRATCQNLPPIE